MEAFGVEDTFYGSSRTADKCVPMSTEAVGDEMLTEAGERPPDFEKDLRNREESLIRSTLPSVSQTPASHGGLAEPAPCLLLSREAMDTELEGP